MLWRRLLHSYRLLVSSSSFTQLPQPLPTAPNLINHPHNSPFCPSAIVPCSNVASASNGPSPSPSLQLQVEATILRHPHPANLESLSPSACTNQRARKTANHLGTLETEKSGGWQRNKGLVCFFMIYFAFILSSLCDLS